VYLDSISLRAGAIAEKNHSFPNLFRQANERMWIMKRRNFFKPTRGLCVAVLAFGLTNLTQAATYTVINSDDNGTGSLRQAILDANTSIIPDYIGFNIPGAGVHTITPLTPLPIITEYVTIDGYSQPGASANTQATGNDATLLIQLNGSSATDADGLRIQATGAIIKGLVINRFNDAGIRINSGMGIRVHGNFIGVSPSGNIFSPNGFGVLIADSSGSNEIGGSKPAERNILSGNQYIGCFIIRTSPGTVVRGNYIGTNPAGEPEWNKQPLPELIFA
jgi:hypothetical protein